MGDDKGGDGVESWPDGSKFEGQFSKGKKHGYGMFMDGTTSAKFIGQFLNDKMDGDCTCSFADGCWYIGRYQGGQMHGHGLMEWPNGSKYKGMFHHALMHGDGVATWADGRVYTGQWFNGKLVARPTL